MNEEFNVGEDVVIDEDGSDLHATFEKYNTTDDANVRYDDNGQLRLGYCVETNQIRKSTEEDIKARNEQMGFIK